MADETEKKGVLNAENGAVLGAKFNELLNEQLKGRDFSVQNILNSTMMYGNPVNMLVLTINSAGKPAGVVILTESFAGEGSEVEVSFEISPDIDADFKDKVFGPFIKSCESTLGIKIDEKKISYKAAA